MLIEVLDVTPLVRVRETFRLTHRLTIIAVFCWFVLGAWATTQPDPGGVFSDSDMQLRALTFMLPLAAVLCAAIPFKGPRAQVLFTAIATFDAVVTVWLGTTIFPASTPERDGLITSIGGAYVSWHFFGRGVVASLQSMVPLRRWRAHRLRLALSRRLWAGEWRGPDAPPADPGEALRYGWREYARFALGWVALAVSIPFWVAIFFVMDPRIRLALYHGDLGEAVRIVSTGSFNRFTELPDLPDVPNLHPANFVVFLLLLFGVVFVRIFIEAWERWRRRDAPIRESEMKMSAESVLLLRSFHEEETRVPVSDQTLRGFSRLLFGKKYDFVDLVADRCSAVGPVKLFGWKQDPPPPRGGERYYVGAEWKGVIGRAIPLARMIVALFGSTEALGWELEEVRDKGQLGKTAILLPPDLYPKQARQRWARLAEFLCADPGYRSILTTLVRPGQAIGACFRGDRVVVFMGDKQQPAYESALDLATILTLADPEVTRGMVTKYVRPDWRPSSLLSRWRESRGASKKTMA